MYSCLFVIWGLSSGRERLLAVRALSLTALRFVRGNGQFGIQDLRTHPVEPCKSLRAAGLLEQCLTYGRHLLNVVQCDEFFCPEASMISVPGYKVMSWLFCLSFRHLLRAELSYALGLFFFCIPVRFKKSKSCSLTYSTYFLFPKKIIWMVGLNWVFIKCVV